MGTCPSSLLVNKVALMLSVEAARYIIRTSPCISALSVGKVSTSFFISWSAAAASCVHYMFFLSVQLLSTLKKGRDLSAPFDKNWIRDANFQLRLFHAKTSALVLRRFHNLSLKCSGSCFPMVTVCSGYLLLTIIFSSTLVQLRTPSVFPREVSRIFFTPSPILSNLCVENTVPIPWMVWNLTAPWIVETTIPICYIVVLPKSIFYGELDLTMMKLRFSLLERGVSPIVISKELLQ
ncbi:hypothetical protein Tco_0449226 [Tanacetum coccineum]